MKKETQKIAKNTSSGAEKVENIEKKVKQKSENGKSVTATQIKREQSAKGDAALGDSNKQTRAKVSVKMQNAQSTNGKAEAESAAAKARVEAALKKKEAKEREKRIKESAKRKQNRENKK